MQDLSHIDFSTEDYHDGGFDTLREEPKPRGRPRKDGKPRKQRKPPPIVVNKGSLDKAIDHIQKLRPIRDSLKNQLRSVPGFIGIMIHKKIVIFALDKVYQNNITELVKKLGFESIVEVINMVEQKEKRAMGMRSKPPVY